MRSISLAIVFAVIGTVTFTIIIILCIYCCVYKYRMCSPIDDPAAVELPLDAAGNGGFMTIQNVDYEEEREPDEERRVESSNTEASVTLICSSCPAESILIPEAPPSYEEALLSPRLPSTPLSISPASSPVHNYGRTKSSAMSLVFSQIMDEDDNNNEELHHPSSNTHEIKANVGSSSDSRTSSTFGVSTHGCNYAKSNRPVSRTAVRQLVVLTSPTAAEDSNLGNGQ